MQVRRDAASISACHMMSIPYRLEGMGAKTEAPPSPSAISRCVNGLPVPRSCPSMPFGVPGAASGGLPDDGGMPPFVPRGGRHWCNSPCSKSGLCCIAWKIKLCDQQRVHNNIRQELHKNIRLDMFGECHYRTARFPVPAKLEFPPDYIVLVR
jgi:hypothetical protein